MADGVVGHPAGVAVRDAGRERLERHVRHGLQRGLVAGVVAPSHVVHPGPFELDGVDAAVVAPRDPPSARCWRCGRSPDALVGGVGRCPMPEPTASCGTTGPTSPRCAMSALLVGYARCSTDQQDLTAQREALSALGVEVDPIYVDHGLTGTNRERPGLREALAACRAGDTLVVTKPTARPGSCPTPSDRRRTHQPADQPLAWWVRLRPHRRRRWLFNALAMVAEFESDLIRLRTRENMKVAEAKGRLRGRQPKLVQHPRSRRALGRRPLDGLPRHGFNVPKRELVSRGLRRGTDSSPRRRRSRSRHPSGTLASRHGGMNPQRILRFGSRDSSDRSNSACRHSGRPRARCPRPRPQAGATCASGPG